MRVTAPEWVPAFHCIADRCQHTCCAGWEIDIDPESVKRYQSLNGLLGTRMAEAIEISENGEASFRMKEDRCPFLNGKGLCDLILELGEDALCDICRDHPRYRSFLPDTTEVGIGLCCEEACRLVLNWQEPMRIVTITRDEENENPEEQAFVELRRRIFDLLQDRSLSIMERYRNAMALFGMELPELDRTEWADRLLSLERMDDNWTDILLQWKKSGCAEEPNFTGWEIAMEQLTAACVHRHFSNCLEDGDPALWLAVSLMIGRMIMDMAAALQISDMEQLIELCRMYSSEVEYSQENMDALTDWVEETL